MMAARQAPLLLALCFAAVVASGVVLDGGATHARAFDGVGALSAGASSRLLADYPADQRAEVLDLLFTPKYGASLQVLKVEIGGDVQSTDGTEPSHARTRDELENGGANCARGYEMWLLSEAKSRNPDIITYGLSWGVPGYVGNNSYFSPENVEYQTAWLTCIQKLTGITIDYMGVWNEKQWGNIEYIMQLRSAFDTAGFTTTKLVLLDGDLDDSFLDALDSNQSFSDAVDVIGVHYPCDVESAAVQASGKRFWASEDLSTPADWGGAGCWGRVVNQNFIRMNQTSTIMRSLVWSTYPNLDCYGAGLMYANEPWSGHYDINPTIWTTAHTTQFTEPGWLYLSTASGGSGRLPNGGTYVTLRSDSGDTDFDWTVVIETLEGACAKNGGCLRDGTATAPQDYTFTLAGGLRSDSYASVWRTNRTHWFVRDSSLNVKSGSFTVRVYPGARR
eukprot:TRINITY_DN1513_c0_g1_i1.p1 TRINITY_DN1513_c0_g1~~TRINITY_DN1513_c0_g1_i1.p1  ORF type:complete len:489 (-),score=53.07 TRINITY_DN1513_c0_g1_i1:1346-2689(-)